MECSKKIKTSPFDLHPTRPTVRPHLLTILATGDPLPAAAAPASLFLLLPSPHLAPPSSSSHFLCSSPPLPAHLVAAASLSSASYPDQAFSPLPLPFLYPARSPFLPYWPPPAAVARAARRHHRRPPILAPPCSCPFTAQQLQPPPPPQQPQLPLRLRLLTAAVVGFSWGHQEVLPFPLSFFSFSY